MVIDIRSRTTVSSDDGINYNQRITDVLEHLVTKIQIEMIIDGDRKHSFRLRNIRRGIKLISGMAEIRTIKDLVHINGIGDGIRRRVNEILNTGTLEDIQEIQKNVTVKDICLLSQVHGIGPKLLTTLYHSGIRSISQLRAAIDSGTLPYGVKIYIPTRIALRYHDDLVKPVPRDLIDGIGHYLKDHIPSTSTFEICGSYRRGAKCSGDIDVLIMTSDALPSLAPLVETLQDEGFLIALLSGGPDKYNGICYFHGQYCRIDLLLTSESEYYPALLHFTGSGLFNQIIRWHANKQGYKLSNLGLSYRPGRSQEEPIPEFQSEKDIFDFLGIRYLEPNDRDL